MKPGMTGDAPAACGLNRLRKPQNMSAITQALRSCRRWNRTVRATTRKRKGTEPTQTRTRVQPMPDPSQDCDPSKPSA